MNEKPKLTPEQMSVLLKIISSKTGKDPINLREELSGDGADGILDALGADREKLRQLMNNRRELETLLSSPQVKALLQEVLGRGE